MSQIEKTQFRNNTGGFIGAVVIGPRGDDRGIAVEPNGTVWLSEAEQRLTANAPRRPEHNPFIEQTFQRINPETGESEDYTVTPLEPISEERFVPSDSRPIPATASDMQGLMEAQAAATGDKPVTVTSAAPTAERRHEEVEQLGDDVRPGEPVQPTPRAAAAAAAAQETFIDPATGGLTHEKPHDGAVSFEERGEEAPVEETAAKSDPAVGEETGAALPPSGPAPQGEFAAREEVGTPVAPQAPATPQPPAPPWTPGG